jgi:hypothetical protein
MLSLGHPNLRGGVGQSASHCACVVFTPVAMQANKELAAQRLLEGREDRRPRAERQLDNGFPCLGAFRAGRSDLDFVAIVTSELGRGELARLRAVHLGRWGSALVGDVALRWRWPLVCNGIYLKRGDLSRSPLEVTPVAGHVAGRFRVADCGGFDVNPVTWHALAHHGIAVRGPRA